MNLPPVLAQGSLDTRNTPLALVQAQQIAWDNYGPPLSLQRFAAEKDDTFRVRAKGGGDFILKICNAGESEVEVDFQIDLLEHIAQADPGMPVPRVLRTNSGEARTWWQPPSGDRRMVRAMTFIPGIPMDGVASTVRQRERTGELLARLRRATAAFEHAGDSRHMPWNVQHLPDIAILLNEVEDRKKRDLLARALDRFTDTTMQLPNLRAQVVHNDFSKSNIVVDATDHNSLRGIIDFGDAVRTAIAIDVSTALLNQLEEQPQEDAFAQGRDLLRGYLRRADLLQEELVMIPHLVMGRVALRALLTTWRARLFPDNAAYILRNTERGWWQLKWFLDRDASEVSESLLKDIWA